MAENRRQEYYSTVTLAAFLTQDHTCLRIRAFDALIVIG